MKISILRALLCVAFLCSLACAQQPQAATTPAESNAATRPQDATATVYVYRYKQYVGSALTPSVYCDETELARMDNGRFFVAKLPAGKHSFHSNDKQSGLDLELKAGTDYYIRVELVTGFMKGHGRLVAVLPEQGIYEVKKLKALGADKIKDTQRVSVSTVEGQ